MGLDVYVGALTRYYTGQWETVVQQFGRQEGIDVEVVRLDDPQDAITDPDEAHEVVSAWMELLRQQLEPHPRPEAAFWWQDDMSRPYFTDKPAWDCYSSLLVWAAYSEHPDLELPPGFVEEWYEDDGYRASVAEGFKTRFGQLLRDTELWIPVEFDFTFRAEDTAGSEVGIGSCMALQRQLRILNLTTWEADAAQISEWRRNGAEYGSPIKVGAKFAFAVFWELCSEAVQHRLPMKLDY